MCASMKASWVIEWVSRLDHQETRKKNTSAANPSHRPNRRRRANGCFRVTAGGATEADVAVGATAGKAGAAAGPGGAAGGLAEGVVLTRVLGTKVQSQKVSSFVG